LQEVVHALPVLGGTRGFFRAFVEFAERDQRKEQRLGGQGQARTSIRPRRWATTALVSRRIPWARSAMRFEAAGIIHRLLKSLAIGFIEHAMGAPEHFGALLLGARAELLDVAGNFELLAQRQVLDTPEDGFDDGHLAAK
jgi:hypothetical protein